MIEIVHSSEQANCITHNGTMHADEIFATAFLELYRGNVRVLRTSKVDLNKISMDTVVYDIGRGVFDHHQIDAKKRDNGIVYSSFGLLWNEFGRDFLERRGIEDVEDVFLGIDKDLVEAIDAEDNGTFPKIEANFKVKTLSSLFKVFNPSYGTLQNEDNQFLRAVVVAKTILEEEIVYIQAKVMANKKINNILDNIGEEKYLILDKYLPYEETLLKNEKANNVLFVAFPSNRGGYNIKTVPKSIEDKTARLLFPEEWAGQENKDLEEVSGIMGLRFCHNGRFIVNCSSLETVYQVLNKLCVNEEG